MATTEGTRRVHTYCIHCAAMCGVVAELREGYLVKVEGDPYSLHNEGTLCPKALAAKQEIYHPDRLKYPVRRTRPKGDPDPGWERISWDEALDTIVEKMQEIKEQYGPEAFFFQKGSTDGSPGSEWYPFFNRLANLYGSPNVGGTGHICCYTRSCPGLPLTLGTKGQHPVIDYDETDCILLVGSNILHTKPPLARKILDAQQRGAKLIVIDPILSPTAAKADIWLGPRPGTDLALLLAMHHVIIRDSLYDVNFLQRWTNAPFLVRDDNGLFMRDGDGAYLVWDRISGAAYAADPWFPTDVRPALQGSYKVNGVTCRPAWQRFIELTDPCAPEWAQEVTWVSADRIREAARVYATNRPASTDWYNGLHHGSNSYATGTALALLSVVTGNFDVPGGLTFESPSRLGDIRGAQFLPKDWVDTSVVSQTGFKVRAHNKEQVGPMNLIAEAMITGTPYPIRGMLSLASGFVTANPNSSKMLEALRTLEFCAVGDIWNTPATQMADIVLPCASHWESEFVNYNPPYLMHRRPIVAPRHECWPDLKIVFELARRLGYGPQFWDGDMRKAFDSMLSSFGVTVDDLDAEPRGIAYSPPAPRHAKYAETHEDTGRPKGVATPTGRLEIYSEQLKVLGYDPLPYWREPRPGPRGTPELAREFPLILCGGFKPMHWIHGQLRSVPWLRECQPEPLVWINRRTAENLGIADGDTVVVETPKKDGTLQGFVRMKAHRTESVHPQVIYVPYGWWQGCDSLGMEDTGILDGSSNVSHLYDDAFCDPVSGTVSTTSYPCRVRKE